MPATDTAGSYDSTMAALQARLAAAIARRTSGDEDQATAISSLGLFRRERLTDPCPCEIQPSIVLVATGAKQLLIGDLPYIYDIKRFVIASLDLPGTSQVLEASPEKPCLGLVFRLDMRLLAELIAHVRLPSTRHRLPDGSAAIGTLTPDLLGPFARLLDLLDAPDDIAVLAPLIEREIHYRLLKTDAASRLMQIASVGSQGHRIARAIDWMKVNYKTPISIDDLAAHVQMSPSSLHHHFRQLTAMSPLQYQKWMRLNEARRMMLNENRDAASAAFEVGYESPSQFSREYSRLFGAPPKRDIGNLRQRAGSVEAN